MNDPSQQGLHVPHPAIGGKKAPTFRPHWGILAEGGALMPVTPGNVVYFIEDPNDPQKIVPVLLQEMTHRKIKAKCACAIPGCTREVTFTARWTGHHKSR